MKENKINFSKDLIIIVILLGIMFFVNPTIGSILFWSYIVYKCFSHRDMFSAFIGNKAYRNRQYDQAINWYKKSALSKVSRPKIIANYVFLELKHGSVEEADLTFRTILSQRNFNEKDLKGLKIAEAIIYWKKGELDLAINTLEALLNDGKVSSTVYETLGYFLISKNDLRRALDFNEKGLSEYKDSAIIKANLGEINYRMGNREKAKEILTPLIENFADFAEPYYYCALILADEGKKEAALELLNKALSLDESFISTLTKDIIKDKIEEFNN